MKTVVLALFVVVALSGCAAEGTAAGGDRTSSDASSRRAVDMSTPDRALKSYWRARDRMAVVMYEARVKADADLRENTKPFLELLTADTRSTVEYPDIQPLETFSRTILEIDLVTDSRAEVQVQIRNTTPVPSGVQITDREAEARREGQLHRYVLEKEGQRWLVAEVWWFANHHNPGWTQFLPSQPSQYTSSQVQTTTFEGW